jgi:hypothetical protein
MDSAWIATLLGFGIVAAVTREVCCVRRKRREAVALKEEVQRWEGEGGQVPGATLGAPATAPTADNPKSYSATT